MPRERFGDGDLVVPNAGAARPVAASPLPKICSNCTGSRPWGMAFRSSFRDWAAQRGHCDLTAVAAQQMKP